jgi:hypothetical protein
MKKILIIALGVLLGTSSANAQTESFGAVSAGMGGTYVAGNDFWSAMNNQAGLADIGETTIGIGYNNDFLLKEMATKYVGLALPVTKNSAVSLNVAQFGFSLLNQTKVGIGYGMKFSEKFSGGIQLDYFHLKLGDLYGSTGALTFELGAIYKLSDQWIIGTHLFNPVMAKLADYNDERMTTVINAGCTFVASEQVRFSAEAEKAMDTKPSVKIGIDYVILDFLSIRAGAASNPTKMAFGFGLNFSNFQLDLAGSYHQVLGFCPSTGIIYRFNNPEK